NEKNDIWLEIPRYENQISWGGGDIFAFLLVPFILFYLIAPFVIKWDVSIFLGSLLTCAFFISFFKLLIRMTYHTPRGTPVRLNRKRQKVYIY
ncbi:DUF6708 domain-containing protein, partial [Citrobacter sp. Ce129]|nr:hypothetical protein [Citrobacter sp. Ce129]